jgi:1-phosphatidylinositol-3-phosphate 5-kinase
MLSEDSDSLKHTFEEVSRLLPSNPFNLTPNPLDRLANAHPQVNTDRTTFSCTVYYPRQFHALRLCVCKGDYSFLQSLSRCAKWKATGGKSGSTFCKTRDDRYVLKYVKKPELKMLLDMSKQYFSYMAQSSFHNLPSMLCRIVGAYQVSWKKSKGDRLNSQYIIVMPNLFYQTPTSRVFDLKGSARNRYIKRKPQDDSTDSGVLLDENLLEFTGGHPIPLDDHAKTLLRLAVFNDTLFLSNMHIVDYSLVVGINEEQKILTMGVIDYIRQYTWDKRLETAVKSTGMIAGQSLPTVISPNSYKQRFRLAMERYFAMVPNHDTKWHVEMASGTSAHTQQVHSQPQSPHTSSPSQSDLI